MFIWPSDDKLPGPSHSLRVSPEYTTVTTRMDSGRARRRKRFTEGIEFVNVVFQLNRVQYATFVGVWRHKINNGADWFTMDLPNPNDVSLTATVARFTGDYSAQHISFENWNVSGTLEIEEATYLTEAAVDALLA